MNYQTHLTRLRGRCPFCAARQRMLLAYGTAYLTYANAPYAPHHLLAIPRRHLTSFMALDAEENDELSGLIRYAVRLLKKAGHRSVTVFVRDGRGSGKSISHLHYHIVPDEPLGPVFRQGGPTRPVLTSAEAAKTVRELLRAKKRLTLP